MWCAITEGLWEEARAPQRGKAPLLGGPRGEGWACHRSFFLHALSQAAGHHLHKLQGWAIAAAAILDSTVRHGRLAKGPKTWHQPMPPPPQKHMQPTGTKGPMSGLQACIPPNKGIMTSTCGGKKQQAPKPKTALRPKKY